MSAARHYRADGKLAVARRHNPFTRSPRGGRILSALTRPLFEVMCPRGFGVIATTGRRTGKRRHRCVRAIVEGDRAYIVMIRPHASARTVAWVAAWALNIQADPNVRLRIHGGRYAGVAREPHDSAELAAAKSAYVASVNRFDYVECGFHRAGVPTRAKIQELHATWFETGMALVVELKR